MSLYDPVISDTMINYQYISMTTKILDKIIDIVRVSEG